MTGASVAAPPPHFLVIVDMETTCDDASDPRRPEVVELPWLVYHVPTRTVVDTKQLFVAPRWNVNPNPPPDAVRALGTDVAFAPSLRHALMHFDTYLYRSFVLSAKSFVLATDGHWDIAHVLLPDAAQKALTLAPHFRSFVDLRADFSRCYPMAPTAVDRKTIFSYLHISTAPRASGLDECAALGALVTRLLADGHAFDRRVVLSDYEWATLPASVPAVATAVATAVGVGAIVRLRGLPWTCSEADVAHFLGGIALVPNGIHLVTNAHGKRSGEAFVQLESADGVALALARHKHMLGRRYIEVFNSSPLDMANHLGRACHKRASGGKASAASRSSFGRQRGRRAGGGGGGGRAGGEAVVGVEQGYAIAAGGICRGRDRQGRASGEAWVTFGSAT
ncbi:unnamed protein product, partial [Agarophyton chilense]